MLNHARHYLNSGEDGKRDIIDYYNAYCVEFVPDNRKYFIDFDDDWCAAFVSVMAHKSGIRAGFPFEVSTYYQFKWAQENTGAFRKADDALDNDLVFFDWDGNGQPDHVGIVVNSFQGDIESIEGNKGDKVAYRKLPWYSPYILGFVRTPTPIDKEDEPTIDFMARCALMGRYGVGDRRREVLGDDYGVVQRRVNELIAEKRQKLKGRK